jgi:hypothetical protein
MKKFIVVILAFLYICTSTGATVHMHYCMGKLAGWDLEQKDAKACSKCGMEESGKKDNGCCKDKHTFIKSTIDQKVTESALQVMQLMAVALPVSFIEIPINNFPTVTEEKLVNRTPPLHHGTPIYIFDCIYRI